MLYVEGSVACGVLQAHFHRLVVLPCCADVPVAEGDGHKGADVQPAVVLVEEESHHVAVRADSRQTLFVVHRLRSEKINVRRFDKHT